VRRPGRDGVHGAGGGRINGASAGIAGVCGACGVKLKVFTQQYRVTDGVFGRTLNLTCGSFRIRAYAMNRMSHPLQ
jgi:hypothetical protein